MSEPLYFPSNDHDIFGWLHRPAAQHPANIGLVICKPFGYESLCAHRSLRVFAETAANLGMPALRFDYLGCGDSADMNPGADQIQQWVEDILAAVAELRRRTGVEQVCLLGVRLGALLATLAAARSGSVGGLILVAPVTIGKRYLRELRTARLAANLGTADQGGQDEGQSGADTSDSVEFSGYAMSPATMDALSKIDLTKTPGPAVADALILDRQDLPVAGSLFAALRDAGVSAQYLTLPGFVEMAMVAPQFARVPVAMTEAIRDWLSQRLGKRMAPVEQPLEASTPTAVDAPKRELKLPADSSEADGPCEYPVSIGSETPLFGIITLPAQKEMRRRGVILLNAGADYHMGPSRMYVSLARRWARSGYYVLRLDLAGLGDSNTRVGKPDDVTFPP
ncbi:MAG TPA: alpha/beta hydrolase, partial [Steroidobacteraceae bacterium]|nr:alpha/beta hydrolase [Steroidobacteraceae bacterium]